MSHADPVDALHAALASTGYIADAELATCASLAQNLQKPLLLEGEAGVGKTGLAKALAEASGVELIRLQCYEGVDASAALYDWNYPRQLLAARHGSGGDATDATRGLFTEAYLLERPLLRAIRQPSESVLLIDEVDRADEEFEALLLELLSDFQVTVPEIGTLSARHRPRVILTSNGTRELSDALRRRCLYFFLDYPSFEHELSIVQARLPALDPALARQAVRVVQQLREENLSKLPGLAETLDWCAALFALGVTRLDAQPERVRSTLVCLLKTRADRQRLHDTDWDALFADSTGA